jgi:multisubunit Na+/H+ antiporter MnhF subunit
LGNHIVLLVLFFVFCFLHISRRKHAYIRMSAYDSHSICTYFFIVLNILLSYTSQSLEIFWCLWILEFVFLNWGAMKKNVIFISLFYGCIVGQSFFTLPLWTTKHTPTYMYLHLSDCREFLKIFDCLFHMGWCICCITFLFFCKYFYVHHVQCCHKSETRFPGLVEVVDVGCTCSVGWIRYNFSFSLNTWLEK